MNQNKKISKKTKVKNSKRLLLDVADIMKSPLTEQGIHYIHDEGDMYKGTAMIIGPGDTPYENGFYFFKFKFPKEYPYKPPTLTYCTNDGVTRFNPNLYRSGKVCVSILNTWKGDQWTSCQSIRSILLTLVTLLNENPLTNEPGFPSTHKSCKPYSRMIEYMNFKIAILGMLKKQTLDPKFHAYYPLLKKHIVSKKDDIKKKITALKKSDINGSTDYVSVYNMKIQYDYAELETKFEEAVKALD